MKHKTQSLSSTRQLKLLLLGFIILLGLLCLYYGSSFAPSSRRSDGDDSFGSDPVFGGAVVNRDLDDLHEHRELNLEVPQSIPVSTTSFSFYCFGFRLIESWFTWFLFLFCNLGGKGCNIVEVGLCKCVSILIVFFLLCLFWAEMIVSVCPFRSVMKGIQSWYLV